MSSATTISVEDTSETPEVNPWLIGVVVSLAAFMEVLDTSIANVALPHIAGSMGASNDESTWVLTSYLVSNAIVLPISGFLVGLLGRKRFFLICIAFFTVSSFLCGLAPSLVLLLLFRVLQGAFGGGLQPMTQAILADTFPPEKRGLAFALYGVTAICAPAIGPTLGGWLTDNYSWRWIFYINVPVGVLTVILVSQLVKDLPYLVREKNRKTSFDFVGFGILAIAVGALQVALDKGQEDDWFGSHFITALLIIAAVGLISLVIWEWFHKEPIVDVHLFKIFNFMSSCVMFFVVGIVLFSSTVLLPQFLQTLMGYTAQKAGMVLSAAAILLLILLQIVGRLTTRLQARHILAFGLDHPCHGYVCNLQAHRSTDQFWWCHMATDRAVLAGRILVRSAYDDGLCWRAERQDECRCRSDELHAQYRAERGNLSCDHIDRETKSVSSIRPRRVHAFTPVQCCRCGADNAPIPCRF